MNQSKQKVNELRGPLSFTNPDRPYPPEAFSPGASRQRALRALHAPQVAFEPQAKDPRQFLYLVRLFLDFYGKSGKRDIEKIERVDLEAFIEHEQDRGLRISTVRTRLACIIAFLHFLMEQEVISGSVLKRGIKFKLPDVLPRAMNPADVRSFSL